MIDFDELTRTLANLGYQGWFVVEAEQDPDKAPPLEYARIGHGTLQKALHAAGYTLVEGKM